VAEKHGSLKVVVYEGLKWQHRQAQEDSRQTKKSPPNRNKAAVSVVLVTDTIAAGANMCCAMQICELCPHSHDKAASASAFCRHTGYVDALLALIMGLDIPHRLFHNMCTAMWKTQLVLVTTSR